MVSLYFGFCHALYINTRRPSCPVWEVVRVPASAVVVISGAAIIRAAVLLIVFSYSYHKILVTIVTVILIRAETGAGQCGLVIPVHRVIIMIHVVLVALATPIDCFSRVVVNISKLTTMRTLGSKPTLREVLTLKVRQCELLAIRRDPVDLTEPKNLPPLAEVLDSLCTHSGAASFLAALVGGLTIELVPHN